MTPAEAAITALVQAAPEVPPDTLRALLDALAADGRPLALAIARVAELVAGRRIDAGVALPALAMATATLGDPTAGEREREAARYEIDTLLPLDRPPPPRPAEPDVPLAQLSRGPRPRT